MNKLFKGLIPSESTTAPATTTPNQIDVYGDVLTVLMSRYETNLKNKLEEHKAALKIANDDFTQFITEFEDDVRAKYAKHCQTIAVTLFDLFETTVTIPENREGFSQYSPIHARWEKGIAEVSFDVTMKVDNTVGFEAEKEHYLNLNEYEYHSQSKSSFQIKKIFVIDPAVAARALELKQAVVDAKQAGYEVECLLSHMNTKERQIKAVVAEKRLASGGFSELLNDPALTALISIDTDLTSLVEVK